MISNIPIARITTQSRIRIIAIFRKPLELYCRPMGIRNNEKNINKQIAKHPNTPNLSFIYFLRITVSDPPNG
jgi:hypothetical protein